MTNLPQYVRCAPYVLYALAVLFGVWSFYNDWTQSVAAFQYGDMGAMKNMYLSSAMFRGGLEAVYILASGVSVQILIAIYDKVASE